ncbi:5496_t:CDS:2 [Cetraspora pellucida]|uniref:5496_t:CDS:1 n=1 Tax=Cetraspora pellucida TaxID=1433469 RepID=A0A9N9EJ97_9GLOM|nr:5496_t:CDS:2 [Cetraspora pellucida]
MPCCVDTIIKINQVCLIDKNEMKLTVIWAIGAYPVESEDCEMEIVLFVLLDENERDPNAQSVFVKNEYYSICGKVVSGTYNNKLRLKITVTSSTHLTIRRDPGSNRCLLKTSLIEINDENAIFEVLVNDYTGQHCSFLIKIAFPYHNNRFKYLMNSICSDESVVFVVGHMKVIEEDLYVYAVDVSQVDINSAVKKKFLV